jgi:hypothetical protein
VLRTRSRRYILCSAATTLPFEVLLVATLTSSAEALLRQGPATYCCHTDYDARVTADEAEIERAEACQEGDARSVYKRDPDVFVEFLCLIRCTAQVSQCPTS